MDMNKMPRRDISQLSRTFNNKSDDDIQYR